MSRGSRSRGDSVPGCSRRFLTAASAAATAARARPGRWTSTATRSWSGWATQKPMAAAPWPQPISSTSGARRPKTCSAFTGPSGTA